MTTLTRVHYQTVCELLQTGVSDRAIARETGVSRGTVRRWRLAPFPPATVRRSDLEQAWKIGRATSYRYLLGAYLGDGTVSYRAPNYWDLRIVNDRRYQAVSEEILQAMLATFPGGRVGRCPSWLGESDILHVAHPAIPRAFPQHGPGRKHLRRIALTDWQLELTREHPEALIRGLIHSDGCRCVNSFRTKLSGGRTANYAYVRYFFTNRSADIRDIFTEHCALLDVRVTQPNHRNLGISYRDSVAILDRLVRPKS